jgi:hypothetical protein
MREGVSDTGGDREMDGLRRHIRSRLARSAEVWLPPALEGVLDPETLRRVELQRL